MGESEKQQPLAAAIVSPRLSVSERPPWPLAVAALIAIAALAASGHEYKVLPLLGAFLLASYGVDLRLDNPAWLKWVLRAAAFGAVTAITVNMPAPDAGFTSWLFGSHFLIVGQLFAVELVIQFWLRRTEGGPRCVVAILLSGVIFTSACSTGSFSFIWAATPAYILFIALSLPRYGKPVVRQWTLGKANWVRFIALALALSSGAAVSYEMHNWRNELDYWSMKVMQPSVLASSISWSASLRSSFNAGLPATRVLRIEGPCGAQHFRAMSFNTYSAGNWGPALELRNLQPVPIPELRPDAEGIRIRCTRLTNLELFFAPLNCAGIDVRGLRAVNWAKDEGGPIRDWAYLSPPNKYTVILADKGGEYQGPLCSPPRTQTMESLLFVPREINPKVNELASKIAGKIPDALKRVQAVEQYLRANYTYSLEFESGTGDPVSEFLLDHKPGHCQFFASAAVMLLRSLKVPTRFVAGFYAHEREGHDVTIVRQRDAHAWAESWVEGHGWVTVEATPPAGMPDQAQISLWTYFRDWLEENWEIARAWLGSLSWPSICILAAVAAISVLVWHVCRGLLKRRRLANVVEFEYACPNYDLAQLAARFDHVLKLQGVPCPRYLTWQEHLCPEPVEREGAEKQISIPGTVKPTPAILNEAEAFLSHYNTARFGRPGDREAIARLHQMVDRMTASPRKNRSQRVYKVGNK